MTRALLAIGIFITALSAPLMLGLSPASAREAPWCAVISMGRGSVYWDCRYSTLEACVPNVLAGNRGFCNNNPRYVGGDTPSRARKKRHAERH